MDLADPAICSIEPPALEAVRIHHILAASDGILGRGIAPPATSPVGTIVVRNMWFSKKLRCSILGAAAALSLVAPLSNPQAAIAGDRVSMHCQFSGESVRAISGKDAIHDDSERLWSDDDYFGIWSDGLDFEVAPNSSRVLMTSNGKAIPARRLLPFRPSRILAETSEADVTRKWWFRFQGLDLSGQFLDVVEGTVEASKTSAEMARANVAFHGQGLCYVFKKCDADTLPDRCTDRHFCVNRAERCGILR
jgi:hypothetical protein